MPDFIAAGLRSAPKTKETYRRRERPVGKETEFFVLLQCLRKPHIYPNTTAYRRDPADKLESGLRRKEVFKLKKNRYRCAARCRQVEERAEAHLISE